MRTHLVLFFLSHRSQEQIVYNNGNRFSSGVYLQIPPSTAAVLHNHRYHQDMPSPSVVAVFLFGAAASSELILHRLNYSVARSRLRIHREQKNGDVTLYAATTDDKRVLCSRIYKDR